MNSENRPRAWAIMHTRSSCVVYDDNRNRHHAEGVRAHEAVAD
jgi:hypothetical protein